MNWITLGQYEESKKSSKTCKNETIRQQLRLSIKRNVQKHCTHFSSQSIFDDSSNCDKFIYRVNFELMNSKKVCFSLKEVSTQIILVSIREIEIQAFTKHKGESFRFCGTVLQEGRTCHNCCV